MKVPVLVARLAQNDLDDADQHIAKGRTTAADQLLDRIERIVEMLASGEFITRLAALWKNDPETPPGASSLC